MTFDRASAGPDPVAAWAAAFVASASEVILGADNEGRVIAWSEGAMRFYGYGAEEILGRSVATFRPVPDLPMLTDILAKLRRGEAVDPYETKHLKKDGTVVDVLVSPSAVRDPRGRIIGSSAIIRDISEAKRVQHTLEEAVERERQMVTKLQELDRVRSTFVSSISHELRTPLTSILGYLELLTDDGELSDGQREMLDIVGRNSDRLLTLIEDLLVLSRIESGSFKTLKEPVDVRNLVVAATCAMRGEAAKAEHELKVDVDASVGSVLGDGAELERLLIELLANAIKFTPRGGKVCLSARRASGGVEICVSDSGMGMSASDQREVFTPFFRSPDAVHHAIQGTGLGLPIVKSIVDQHGGTITSSSTPGEGTTMTVTLPFAIAARRAS